MPTTTTTTSQSAVLDAMANLQTESDRWHLAEALWQQIPTGVQGFGEIVDAATAAGVAGQLSANTLRLYRDTAVRWPSAKRVAKVSFSAHREAMVIQPLDDAVKMLEGLAKNLGPDKVTVASVRKAIAVQQGKPVPGTANGSKAKTQTSAEVLADLSKGGTELISTIGSALSSDELDKIHAGLTKVIAHVERLRAKAARAAKPKATAAVPTVKATPANGKGKVQGDLRNL